MGTLYVDTAGAATNSGSTDQNTANLSGAAATVVGSVVTLDGIPDLTGVVTSGATQSSIHIDDASNSNLKIFWITAVDNVGKTVTVHAAPTGVVSSAWAIGGRHVLTNASIEGALRGGDTIIFNNSPASTAGTMWTFRTAGSGTTTGVAKIRGATGTRPVFTCTGTAVGISSAVSNIWIENLEIQQQGASGNAITCTASGVIILNVKISDAGGLGIACTGLGESVVMFCEISGVGSHGYSVGSGHSGLAYGNYIHDLAGNGIEDATNPAGGPAVMATAYNIIDTVTGVGINISAASSNANAAHHFALCNTVYASGSHGMATVDADRTVILINNILKDNGNTGSEYNLSVTAVGIVAGRYNIFNIDGALGGGNVSGYTLDSSDLTTDPLFTDPGGGDFSLQDTSPALGAGFPGTFLGGSIGNIDIGAVQASGGSGTTVQNYGFSWLGRR